MKTAILALIFTAFYPALSHAGFTKTPAFSAEDSEKFTPFQLTAAEFKAHKKERYAYGPVSFTFREDDKELAGAPILKILDGFGKTIYGPTALAHVGNQPFGPLWIGDLNGDGKPDYVVKSGSLTKNTFPETNRIYVILSSEDKPSVVSFDTVAFQPEDIRKLPDGSAAILVGRSLETSATLLHKSRTYLAYDLVKLGDRIVEQTNAGFPRVQNLAPKEVSKLWAAEIHKRPLFIEYQ